MLIIINFQLDIYEIFHFFQQKKTISCFFI